MKKIGIVTVYGNTNYGNKFQNYAVQKIFEKLGYEAFTINTEKDQYGKNLKKFLKYLLGILGIKRYKNDKSYLLNRKREIIFKEFSTRYLKIKNYTSKCDLEISSGYDFYSTGSDQVWNDWGLGTANLDFYFLQFTTRNKRLAVSPSFGISKIKPELKESYSKGLSGFNIISCREEQGKKLISELVNTECVVLVDPTMILDRLDWLEITNESSLKPNGKYIFTYFLGEITNDYWDYINRIADNYNLQIVNLMDINNRETYFVGPSQFLSLLNNAELICTDSFHGTVFSILFEKPFVCFDRTGMGKEMDSRIKTILSNFNFENRQYGLLSEADLFTIDFSEAIALLIQERCKFYEYIHKAIDLNDTNGGKMIEE